MKTHYHLLAEGLVLTLCADDDPNSQSLADALARARRHGCPLIWVNCRRVPTLPTEAIALLQQHASLLWLSGGHLLLCHLSAGARAALAGNVAQPLAASLLDATTYGIGCPPEAYLR